VDPNSVKMPRPWTEFWEAVVGLYMLGI